MWNRCFWTGGIGCWMGGIDVGQVASMLCSANTQSAVEDGQANAACPCGRMCWIGWIKVTVEQL